LFHTSIPSSIRPPRVLSITLEEFLLCSVCLCVSLSLSRSHGLWLCHLITFVKIQWYARSGWRSGFFENDGTGPVCMHLNGTLGSKATSAAKNRFTITISMVNGAIRKLVRVTPIIPDKCHIKLYRGISRMAMPEQFFKLDKNNCRGFEESGFTSATTDRKAAIHYAGREVPSILEIHTGQVDHGGSRI